METWKLSTDPQFVTKVRDVVGIYLSPPENVLVLAVDEKSQIQALNRTPPVLPMAPTVPARMTHDYVRHGTTSLFAALDIVSGSVIAQHYRRHRRGSGEAEWPCRAGWTLRRLVSSCRAWRLYVSDGGVRCLTA